MSKRFRPLVALAAGLLILLATAGAASAATAPLQIFPYTQRLALGTQDVQQLVDGGARIEVSSKEFTLHRVELRLFVYQRALNRGGGPTSKYPASWKFYVSNLGHLDFTRPGNQYITLHIDEQYAASLLHAGPITLGVTVIGYS